MNQEPLGTWIQGTHLGTTALENYRRTFDHYHYLCIEQFLPSSKIDGIDKFLIEQAQYDRRYFLRSDDGNVSKRLWDVAVDSDKLTTFTRLNQAHRYTPSIGALLCFKLLDFFSLPLTTDHFTKLTGLPLNSLDSVGVKKFEYSDFLNPHSDRDRNRKLAFILYTNANWRIEYGGHLNFHMGNNDATQIDYTYNRLVLFDVHQINNHFLSAINKSSGQHSRLSIGGWYK
jgi:Rps23 Pro-64 3,4-dihydroxylase Tpa1-like proline 4-hydroxylase